MVHRHPINDRAFQLPISALIGEAWQKTKGFKGNFWLALIPYVLASIVFIVLDILIKLLFFFSSSPKMVTMLTGILISNAIFYFFFGFFLHPLLSNVMRLSIARSQDVTHSMKTIFDDYQYAWRLGMAYVISSTCIVFPWTLYSFYPSPVTLIASLFLPLYFFVSYFMVIPLITVNKMEVWQALETSRKTIGSHWFKVFGLILLFTGIFLVSIIPLGIGLIWSLPWLFNIYGIIYRELFLTSRERVETSSVEKEEEIELYV